MYVNIEIYSHKNKLLLALRQALNVNIEIYSHKQIITGTSPNSQFNKFMYVNVKIHSHKNKLQLALRQTLS